MTGYERRCRVLLEAFPAEYRAERGEELVGVLLDANTKGRNWPSLATAIDLVSTALRVRARMSTHGRTTVALIDGLRWAATAGLCLQAAFSVAMVTHYARDGVLFYLLSNAWAPASHGVLAAIWVLAFGLTVTGRLRLAGVPAVVATAGTLIPLVSHLDGGGAGLGVSATLLAIQMTLLGVVPTLAVVTSAVSRRSRRSGRATVWVGPFVALTVTFALLDTPFSRDPGGGGSMTYPPSGSLMSFLFWLWMAALVAALVASRFDPRVGIAILVLAVPLLVYLVGLGVQASPAWTATHVLPAVVTTALVAVGSAASLRRLRA